MIESEEVGHQQVRYCLMNIHESIEGERERERKRERERERITASEVKHL